jgi:hypothetical protein
MVSPLDARVATILARTARTFRAASPGPASGLEFEQALYEALVEVPDWHHVAGPDQLDMSLPIASRTGTRYEFDGAFVSSDTLYVLEAKRLSGGGVSRGRVGILVQKLLDIVLGS